MKYLTYSIVFCFFFVLSSFIVVDREIHEMDKFDLSEVFAPTFMQGNTTWALKTLETLSTEEKIAQLCFVRSSSKRNKAEEAKLSKLVKKYGIGGITFFKGTSEEMKVLGEKYQDLSKIPLIYSIDGEWGASMRLTDMPKYPWMMTLGAITDDKWVYKTAAQMASEFKSLGIHMNLGPDVDVNNNPNNPIINSRSFGENKVNVARKGVSYMKGLEDNGVMACAKHFPGHGDTDMDSHLTLPRLNFTRQRLDSIEHYPFIKVIDAGISSMMIAHLDIPKITGEENLPASVSQIIVDSILRKEFLFGGVVMTDGLAMKGVQDHYNNGRLELEALKAGNDVLLLPQNVKAVIDTVMWGIKNKEYSIEQLDASCLRVLMMKSHLGLDSNTIVSDTISFDQASLLKEDLMENAFTLVKNENNLLPFRKLDSTTFAWASFGETTNIDIMKNQMLFYADFHHKHFKSSATEAQFNAWLKKQKNKQIVVSIHKSDANPWKSYKLSTLENKALNSISDTKNGHLVVFANPYAVRDHKSLNQFKSINIAYQNNKEALFLAPQFLFGARSPKGKLPVSLSATYKESTGLSYKSLPILRWENPLKFGLKPEDFSKVDSIIKYSISHEAIPGCQLLVAKDGQIIFNKSYGYQTYDKKLKINNQSVYDLASITKVTASVPTMMYLYEKNKFSLNDKLGELTKSYKGTNKERLTFQDILTHQAKLKPWIPFYFKTLTKEKKRDPKIYASSKSKLFNIPVANGIYMNNHYLDSIQHWVTDSDLREASGYKYSDLGYYLLKEFIEQSGKLKLESFPKKAFYKPLGAYSLGYKPKKSNKIVPSEKDDYFRNKVLRGEVHDMGAAMLGGVGGHAGLFSSASDLAKIMQMYLQRGEYGDHQYFLPSTVDTFTACQFCDSGNRRGLGFDKPVLEKGSGPSSELASAKSFGHTGFTGTMAWADPENGMIFIFLSNRTYPTMKNTKLIKWDVRTKLQTEFYNLLKQK